jgi:hypothetical protein
MADRYWRVPGDIGRRYARVSGDSNPIHLHPLTAKALGQPGAIAHAMWTKARCLAALEACTRGTVRRPRLRGVGRGQAAPRGHGHTRPRSLISWWAASVFPSASIPSLRLTPGARSNWMSR